LYFTESKVTSDFIVDVLADFWKSEEGRFSEIKTLVINQDNGGENNSRRTQFMKRIVEFAQEYQLNIRLAYYPPYHSKYNPIERTWAVLENYWNGSILDEVETALNFAHNMTWNGKHGRSIKINIQPCIKLTGGCTGSGERRLDIYLLVSAQKNRSP
jgi:transposase